MAQWAVRTKTASTDMSDQLELLRSPRIPGMVRVRDGFLGVLPHPGGEAPPAGRNLW